MTSVTSLQEANQAFWPTDVGFLTFSVSLSEDSPFLPFLVAFSLRTQMDASLARSLTDRVLTAVQRVSKSIVAE